MIKRGIKSKIKVKKQIFLIFGIFLMGILLLLNVSAVCCEKLKDDGYWCQPADSDDECDANYRIQDDAKTCKTVPYCHMTCVNENTGACGILSEGQCRSEGGIPYEEPMEEVPACQAGCCLAGQNAYFPFTANECKFFAGVHGINTDFREDITSYDACEELVAKVEVGACLISTETQKACKIKTNEECDESNLVNLAQEAEINVGILSGIELDFFPGELCTSPNVGSDCARTKNTICGEDGKVYYLDSCSNFANIYDESKYNDNNYWRYIYSPYDIEVCTVGPEGSAVCGNCNPVGNTVCRNEKDVSGLNAPSGDYVCGDLGCVYEGTHYHHLDSWCAGVGTALVGIEKNTSNLAISEKSREELKDQDTYNTPGSKYFKLTCAFGEVLLTQCSDYRNEICAEYAGEDENGVSYSSASCMRNSWPYCTSFTTKTQCENPKYLCKWVPGYRTNAEMPVVPEEDRREQQGSCVPLVPPGFDFWEGDTQGSLICAMGIVKEIALFETNIWRNRDNYDAWLTERNDGKFLHNRCFNGCYAIPGYGIEFDLDYENGEEKMYPEEIQCSEEGDGEIQGLQKCYNLPGCTDYQYLTEFYDESECQLFESGSMEQYHLSDRRGQYCHKDGKEDHWLTGEITGSSYSCTPGLGGAFPGGQTKEEKDEEKERDYPIYLTHNEWLDSITERARSMGDCGFKPNVDGDYSDENSEIITAIFQKMDQKGNVKRNVTAKQIIYKGDEKAQFKLEYIPDGEPIILPVEVEVHDCADNGGTCILIMGEETCETAEGSCPYGLTCCNVDAMMDEEDNEGGT